ncbi:MAG: hypothetical protein JOZ72_04215 [Alphaproteobacteria bacterium]|nr:hypothetical protein [Alphaproteobacteria bacterium]
MPLYQFIIHGRMADETGGFYTTRWCRAPDERAAVQQAMKMVHQSWHGPPIHALEVEEGRRIRFWDIRSWTNHGSTFYFDGPTGG